MEVSIFDGQVLTRLPLDNLKKKLTMFSEKISAMLYKKTLVFFHVTMNRNNDTS